MVVEDDGHERLLDPNVVVPCYTPEGLFDFNSFQLLDHIPALDNPTAADSGCLPNNDWASEKIDSGFLEFLTNLL